MKLNNCTSCDKILEFGFPSERARLIHGFIGGSALHGVKLHGTDDLDLYGIFVEHPETALGLDRFEHFVTSTAAQGDRNTAKDVDVTCYSLRKWAGLALNGNPTVLQFLFTPAQLGEMWWSSVLGIRQAFLSKSHAHKYMGYADAQLKRMVGCCGKGKHGQRPELESKFGYDAKAGMHALSLLLEGIELLRDGWITLPRPDSEREWLLSVRQGKRSEEWVIREADRLFGQIRNALAVSSLPDSPDRQKVSEFVAVTYLDVWRANCQIGATTH